MPTKRKVEEVEKLRKLIDECVVVISADHSGMKVGTMTQMRRTLRQRGVRFHVVKNRLTYLAADAAGKPLLKEIVRGPTGIAFGFADPAEPAKALTEFVRDTGFSLKILGGMLGDRILSEEEVATLAALPSKDDLLAQLAGQLQGPVTSLAYVLAAPVSALARVLQRRIEIMNSDDDGQQPLTEVEVSGGDKIER